MTRVEIPAQELYTPGAWNARGVELPLYDLSESIREQYGIPRSYAYSRMMSRYVFLIFFDEEQT